MGEREHLGSGAAVKERARARVCRLNRSPIAKRLPEKTKGANRAAPFSKMPDGWRMTERAYPPVIPKPLSLELEPAEHLLEIELVLQLLEHIVARVVILSRGEEFLDVGGIS